MDLLLDEEELKRIEEYCEAALEGPWYAFGPLSEDECQIEGGIPVGVCGKVVDDDNGFYMVDIFNEIEECEDIDTADFIANARTDLPAAIATIRYLLSKYGNNA